MELLQNFEFHLWALQAELSHFRQFFEILKNLFKVSFPLLGQIAFFEFFSLAFEVSSPFWFLLVFQVQELLLKVNLFLENFF